MELSWSLEGNPAHPPLLLLHGFLGSQAEWRPWLPRLCAHWYCLRVDLPGHGGSQTLTIDPDTGFESLCDALHARMMACSRRPWAVWGYSLGGRVALSLALSERVPIRWLLLESMHPGLARAADRAARCSADEVWAGRLEQEPLARVLEDWYRQPVFADLAPAARDRLIEERCDNDPQALAAMLRATSLGRQPDGRAALLRAAFPWRYLAGAKDAKFAAIARHWPRARAALVPEAGHNIHRERPEALWSALQAFLSHAGLVKEMQ